MQYLTNHSNSQAGTLDAIGIEQRKHWYRGLRQAELIIRDKSRALSSNYRARDRIIRELQFLEESLGYLKILSKCLHFVPVLGRWLLNRVCDQQVQIEDYQESLEEQESLIRDCELEHKSAIQQREQILKAHPEVLALSYEQIEEFYGKIALLEQKVSYLAPREFARQQGISLELSIALFEADEVERRYLIDRVIQKNVETGLVFASATHAIPDSPVLVQLKSCD